MNTEKYKQEYSPEKLRAKLEKGARTAGVKVVYAVLVLYYVMESGKTPLKDKAMVLGALGYFILPLDLVPDFLPLLGYTDDLASLLAVIRSVAQNITPEVKEKARRTLEHWFGEVKEADLPALME